MHEALGSISNTVTKKWGRGIEEIAKGLIRYLN
jgi:hypothetical protein